MISEQKKDEKLPSFPHSAKDRVFFFFFLRSSFGRIKVMSPVVERKHTPDIPWHIYFAYQSTGLYNKRFYWTVFPIVIV